MAYRFVIQENQDHVRVEVSGDWIPNKELDDSSDVLAKVADICRKKNINHILAIWDVPGHLPAITAFNVVEYSNKFNWDHDFKLAVVHTHHERYIDALFIETVAYNRGYRVKMFENEQEAKTWLLGS